MTTYLFEPTSRPREPGPDPVPATASGEDSRDGADEASRSSMPPRPRELEELTPGTAGMEADIPSVDVAPRPTLDELLEQAREDGRLAGVEEGRRLEEVRLKRAIDSVKGLVSGIESAAAQREQEARARVVVLATAIATHLLERESKAAPDLISDLTRRAIAEFPVRDVLRVHLNPSDLALMSGGASPDPGRAALTSGQQVRWVPDPNVRSGGCLVKGTDRIVDARVSTTVERICRALIDV